MISPREDPVPDFGMNGRISAIDGWRAISVTLVIVSHVLARIPLAGRSAIAILVSHDYGALGVRIFFVISGFVICRSFIQERKKNKIISIAAFYIRRVFRIQPPLLLYLLVICSLALMGFVDRNALGASKGLFFICDIDGVDCGGYLGNHQWSLAVEEQFYLVFPLLFLTRGKQPNFFLAAMAAIPTLSLALAMLGFANAASFIATFVFISAGVFLAFNESRITNLAAKLPPGLIAAAAIAVLIISIMPPGRSATILIDFVLPLLIGFVLLATTLVRSSWQRVLAARPMVAFGRISYGVYLWQQLATYPFRGAGYLFYLCSLCACVIFCFASFYYFERPLIGYGHKLSRRLQGSEALNGQRVSQI